MVIVNFLEKAKEYKEQGFSSEEVGKKLLVEGAMFVDVNQIIEKVFSPEEKENEVKQIKVEKASLEEILMLAKSLKDKGKSPLDIKIALLKNGYHEEGVIAAIKSVSGYKGVAQKKEMSNSAYIWGAVFLSLVLIRLVLRLIG